MWTAMWWRQPRIFISYRRDDSAVHARAIYDELVASFGEKHVFLDVEEINYGDQFAHIINERINACDVVVAVIGPLWLTLTAADGQSRIWSDQDYVHCEIATALRSGKQLIPVLVGGAEVPVAAALPADIAGLAERNILTFSDRQLGEGIDRLVDAIRGSGSATDSVTKALLRRMAHAIGFAAALGMLFAAWIGLFDFFTLDTKTASLTLWLADVVAPEPVSPDLRLVVIDADTEHARGKTFRGNPAARRDHAMLISRLTQAGARTIAFDLFATTPSEADDAVLVQAIGEARSHGTAVVFGANEMHDGQPAMVPALRAAVTTWAMLCIGQRLGYASTVPLASQQRTPASGAAARAPVKAQAVGLALAAANPGHAKIADHTRTVIVSRESDGAIAEFPYSEIEVIGDPQACHVGLSGDAVATALYRMSPLAALQADAHRLAYERVLALDADTLHRRFHGKTVLVGVQLPNDDVFSVFRGWTREQRHGLELHADATSALLKGAIVQPLGWSGQFAVMLAFGLLGSRLQLWTRQSRHGARRAVLLVALVACLGLAVWLCVALRLLLNVTYVVGALAVGHWAAGRRGSPKGLEAAKHALD